MAMVFTIAHIIVCVSIGLYYTGKLIIFTIEALKTQNQYLAKQLKKKVLKYLLYFGLITALMIVFVCSILFFASNQNYSIFVAVLLTLFGLGNILKTIFLQIMELFVNVFRSKGGSLSYLQSSAPMSSMQLTTSMKNSLEVSKLHVESLKT
jgi:hypothetical protein